MRGVPECRKQPGRTAPAFFDTEGRLSASHLWKRAPFCPERIRSYSCLKLPPAASAGGMPFPPVGGGGRRSFRLLPRMRPRGAFPSATGRNLPWRAFFRRQDRLRMPREGSLARGRSAGRKKAARLRFYPGRQARPGRRKEPSVNPAERARRRRSAAFLPWWRSWPCTSGRPWPRPEPRECGPPSSSARRSAP